MNTKLNPCSLNFSTKFYYTKESIENSESRSVCVIRTTNNERKRNIGRFTQIKSIKIV